MLNRILGFLLLSLCASLPLRAQLQSAELERGGGLRGSEGGLNGGSLDSGRLEKGRLKSSSLRGAKLESAKPMAGGKRLSPASLKRKATELTEGGLGVKELQGAASTIPRTQVGALLYDVASLLLLQDVGMKDVAVGYYMAVLADPEGERHDDALARLKEIFLDKELEHKEAVRLYDSGLETMKSLIDIKIGLTEAGRQAGLLSLQEVKLVYHHRRKQDVDEKPAQEHPETEKPIDALIEPYRVPLSEQDRENASQQEASKDEVLEKP